jgi:hypothetical protein
MTLYDSRLVFLDSSTNPDVVAGRRTSDDFTTLFQPNLILGGRASIEATKDNNEPEYEAALISFAGWNSVPNISAAQGNNTFQYITPALVVRNVIFDDGIYSFAQMQSVINSDLLAAGQPINSITLTPNTSTGKVAISVAAGFQVVFVGLWRILAGFELSQSPIIGPTVAVGNLLADITNGIDSFLIHCDLVIDSTVNSSASDVILTYRPTTRPGSNVNIVPAFPVYASCRRNDFIDRIRVYITDQQLRPVSFRGEDLNIQLHIRRKQSQNIRILPSSVINLQ